MYRELAQHYDRIYASKDYAVEAERVREIISQHSPHVRSVLDVACGTGGHLVHLQRHFECEGVDLNREMVDIAQAKVPELKLHVADMTDFDLGREFDAVICLFSAVGHLVTVEKLIAAVRTMAGHLHPQGILLIEPWIDPNDWIAGHTNMDTFDGEDLKIARISTSEPVDRGRIVMEYLIGTNAGVERLRDEHQMGWFTREEYVSSFEKAGLRVRHDPYGTTGRGMYIGTSSE